MSTGNVKIRITTTYELGADVYRDDVQLGDKSIYDVGDLVETYVEEVE